MINVDAVTNIVGMLDEEEDTAGQELRDCAADCECKACERCPELCSLGRESLAEESGVDEGDSWVGC